jgi:hypothetical protein
MSYSINMRFTKTSTEDEAVWLVTGVGGYGGTDSAISVDGYNSLGGTKGSTFSLSWSGAAPADSVFFDTLNLLNKALFDKYTNYHTDITTIGIATLYYPDHD